MMSLPPLSKKNKNLERVHIGVTHLKVGSMWKEGHLERGHLAAVANPCGESIPGLSTRREVPLHKAKETLHKIAPETQRAERD